MSALDYWFRNLAPPVAAAVVAAIVALATSIVTMLVAPVVKYAFDKRLEERKLDFQYRAEQQKALRDRLARYKGFFLIAAETLNYRLWDFYKHEPERWLRMSGQYASVQGNYPQSTAYRILSVLAVARLVERESLYVDVAVATPSDFQFVTALRLTIQVWTDARLFDSLAFDNNSADDFLFRETIRRMTDSFHVDQEGGILSPSAFDKATEVSPHPYWPMFRFLDDLHRGEGRLRLDRLLSAHLVLIATLNAFGYPYHRTPVSQVEQLAQLYEHPVILSNLAAMITRLGLERNHAFANLVKVMTETLYGQR